MTSWRTSARAAPAGPRSGLGVALATIAGRRGPPALLVPSWSVACRRPGRPSRVGLGPASSSGARRAGAQQRRDDADRGRAPVAGRAGLARARRRGPPARRTSSGSRPPRPRASGAARPGPVSTSRRRCSAARARSTGPRSGLDLGRGSGSARARSGPSTVRPGAPARRSGRARRRATRVARPSGTANGAPYSRG